MMGARLGGAITTGGVPVDPVVFRANIAYVMQDDSLLPFETPRECLHFSACPLAEIHFASEKEVFDVSWREPGHDVGLRAGGKGD